MCMYDLSISMFVQICSHVFLGNIHKALMIIAGGFIVVLVVFCVGNIFTKAIFIFPAAA